MYLKYLLPTNLTFKSVIDLLEKLLVLQQIQKIFVIYEIDTIDMTAALLNHKYEMDHIWLLEKTELFLNKMNKTYSFHLNEYSLVMTIVDSWDYELMNLYLFHRKVFIRISIKHLLIIQTPPNNYTTIQSIEKQLTNLKSNIVIIFGTQSIAVLMHDFYTNKIYRNFDLNVSSNVILNKFYLKKFRANMSLISFVLPIDPPRSFFVQHNNDAKIKSLAGTNADLGPLIKEHFNATIEFITFDYQIETRKSTEFFYRFKNELLWKHYNENIVHQIPVFYSKYTQYF